MSLSAEAFIDWYQATIEDQDDDRVGKHLALSLGATLAPGKPRLGYAIANEVRAQDGEVLAIVYGRSARLGEVHVLTTGSPSRRVVPVLRRLFPVHRVSRADSAVDLSTDYDECDRRTLEFATARGISWRLVQDSDSGQSRYLGAPTSEVRMRLYRKTEQMRSLHPDQAATIPDRWVRAEVQVRPGKQVAKEAASLMEAPDYWGFAAWSSLYSLEMFGLQAQRTPTHFRRATDWERQTHWIGRQYGPAFAVRCSEAGETVAARELLAAVGLDLDALIGAAGPVA